MDRNVGLWIDHKQAYAIWCADGRVDVIASHIEPPAHYSGGTQLGGVQKTTDFLDKSTWTLATLLLALILLSNVTIMDGNTAGESKIMGGEDVEMNVPAPINTPTQDQDTSN